MTKFLSIGGLILALFGFAAGCETDNSTDYLNDADCTGVDATTNTYTKSIKTILNNSCARSGCHTAASRANDLDLSTYSTAKSGFENMDCLCSIHHGSTCKAMPENGAKLDDATIKLIDCWAKNGYIE